MPAAVVLPEPWRPQSRITVGGLDAKVSFVPRRAEQLGELLVDDLHDLLARRQAREHLLADGALAHGGDERLDDAEVDVGLEQREADLAHRAIDVLGAERAAGAQIAERCLQFVGERLEHEGRMVAACMRGRVPER